MIKCTIIIINYWVIFTPINVNNIIVSVKYVETNKLRNYTVKSYTITI